MSLKRYVNGNGAQHLINSDRMYVHLHIDYTEIPTQYYYLVVQAVMFLQRNAFLHVLPKSIPLLLLQDF